MNIQNIAAWFVRNCSACFSKGLIAWCAMCRTTTQATQPRLKVSLTVKVLHPLLFDLFV